MSTEESKAIARRPVDAINNDVEHWGHGDDMGMMRQLGATP